MGEHQIIPGLLPWEVNTAVPVVRGKVAFPQGKGSIGDRST